MTDPDLRERIAIEMREGRWPRGTEAWRRRILQRADAILAEIQRTHAIVPRGEHPPGYGIGEWRPLNDPPASPPQPPTRAGGE